MPAPQALGATGGDPYGITAYYIPHPDEAPNVFASFWSSYLAQRTPYARQVIAARLAELNPKGQYDAIAAMARVREQLLAQQAENDRAVMGDETRRVIEESQARRDYYGRDLQYAGTLADASARVAVGSMGLKGELAKAGKLDQEGADVVSTFADRKAAAERKLADAYDAGDAAAAKAAYNDLNNAAQVARDQIADLARRDPLQANTVATQIGALPSIVEAPAVQDRVNTVIQAAVGNRETPDVPIPGWGARPPSAGASAAKVQPLSRGAAFAERAYGPSAPPAAGGGSPPAAPREGTGGGGEDPVSTGGSSRRAAPPSQGSPAMGPGTSSRGAADSSVTPPPSGGGFELPSSAALRAELARTNAAIAGAGDSKLPEGFSNFEILPFQGGGRSGAPRVQAPKEPRPAKEAKESQPKESQPANESIGDRFAKTVRPKKAAKEDAAAREADLMHSAANAQIGSGGAGNQVTREQMDVKIPKKKTGTKPLRMGGEDRGHSTGDVSGRGSKRDVDVAGRPVFLEYGPDSGLAPDAPPAGAVAGSTAEKAKKLNTKAGAAELRDYIFGGAAGAAGEAGTRGAEMAQRLFDRVVPEDAPIRKAGEQYETPDQKKKRLAAESASR